jgi:hypothetical protein
MKNNRSLQKTGNHEHQQVLNQQISKGNHEKQQVLQKTGNHEHQQQCREQSIGNDGLGTHTHGSRIA